MATAAETLDDGIKFDGDDDEKSDYRAALYGGLLGSDQVDGGVGFGSFHLRVATLVTGQAVTGGDVTLTTPGPVIAVQVTNGLSPGVYPIACVGPPEPGQCWVTTSSTTGCDRIRFNTDDDQVFEIAYRQIAMPAALHAALKAAV